MSENIKYAVLEAIEVSLVAQLKAIRRLRHSGEAPKTKNNKSMSNTEMAYNILKNSKQPLHVIDLIAQIKKRFGADIERESLVSAITKKIAKGELFLRTDKNTFSALG